MAVRIQVTKDVLVIAADTAFRRSLRFLFEAEGLCVDVLSAFPSDSARASRVHACTVIDDSAFGSGWDPARTGTVVAATVVLAADLALVPIAMVGRALRKPVLGSELVDQVKIVLSQAHLRENP